MKIEFEAPKLKKVFNEQAALVRSYGPQMARKIMMRLAVLKNAPSLADVPTVKPDRCHQLGHDRNEQFAVDLIHPHRLIFAVHDHPVPRKADGGIDLTAVTAIRIQEVVDYHGS